MGAQLRTPGDGRILKLRAYEDNLALYRATIQASWGLPSSYQAMPTTVDHAVCAATSTVGVLRLLATRGQSRLELY